jgi:hypothetical protein
VFLAYKNTKQDVGRSHYSSVKDLQKLKTLYEYCDQHLIRYGMDSCSGPNYLKTIKGCKEEKQLASAVEACCATRFSSYINVNMEYFPCSFLEHTKEWKKGLSLISCNDFLHDIWNNPRVEEYRKYVLECGEKRCPCHFFD